MPKAKPIISLAFASLPQIGELSGKTTRRNILHTYHSFLVLYLAKLGGTSPSRPHVFMREKKVGCKDGGKSKNLGGPQLKQIEFNGDTVKRSRLIFFFHACNCSVCRMRK